MQKITTYGPSDLTHGKCKCCGEISSEIVIGEDMCADCVQDIEFEEMCMKMMEGGKYEQDKSRY
ncbi:hypothetical protein IR083_09980 [Dysgonomonas sp. GY75]|uniref:hypothetical protein n=1 Tax=Dysgonomonas sp. GY75 TaxID=2780419 RepID=UPI001884207D|nr:hypothetical protein [Dysgonomonas sp. GY75]MBF0649148.1 hypothetical protein [Dysgonomonas sp. GY75]